MSLYEFGLGITEEAYDRLGDVTTRALQVARGDAEMMPDRIAELVLREIKSTETWRALADMWARIELENVAIEAYVIARNERSRSAPR